MVVPIVAELPTCQKTFFGTAPPLRTTLLPVAVVRPEAIWKIHTSVAEPVSATSPVIESVDVDL